MPPPRFASIAELVEQALATAPRRSFTLTPRNPARQVTLGGNHINFGLVAGPPNVHDRERGRRSGNFSDYCDFIRLAHYFNAIHLLGNQVCAPIELPASSRHLDTYRANIRYCDLAFHVSAIGAGRALDGIRMMAIARGITLEEIASSPGVITIISVNSPRRFDEGMTEGLVAMATHGQPVVTAPFHPDGRYGAGIVGRGAGAAKRRGAFRCCSRAGCASRDSRGVRRFHVERRSALRCAGLRHTRRTRKQMSPSGQLARRYGLPYVDL